MPFLNKELANAKVYIKDCEPEMYKKYQKQDIFIKEKTN
jgi:hypothetical protein